MSRTDLTSKSKKWGDGILNSHNGWDIEWHWARSSVEVLHRRSARLLTASPNTHNHLSFADDLYQPLNYMAFVCVQILAFMVSNFRAGSRRICRYLRIPTGTWRRCHFCQPCFVIKREFVWRSFEKIWVTGKLAICMYHKTRTDKKVSDRARDRHMHIPAIQRVQRSMYLHWRPFIRRHHRNPLRENRGEIVHGENAHHSDKLPILRLLTFHLHKATYILLPTPFFSSPSYLALTFPSLFSFFPAVSSCAAASSVRAQVGSRLVSQYTELQNLTTTCRQGCIRHRWPTCPKADATTECEKVVPKGFAQSGCELWSRFQFWKVGLNRLPFPVVLSFWRNFNFLMRKSQWGPPIPRRLKTANLPAYISGVRSRFCPFHIRSMIHITTWSIVRGSSIVTSQSIG